MQLTEVDVMWVHCKLLQHLLVCLVVCAGCKEAIRMPVAL